ncbi:bifunctional nicotinamidase/pyrazinamidase [Rhizobium sp.]|uniref:bifunctional nicotinamidase/pyrazinamidase n=1 Tax=Rhizobium sp. TaxID=391 RepID=UPI002AA61C30
MRMTKALLLIDLQNGFCPGGNLPVAEGNQVIPVANTLMAKGYYDLIIASQDWHPANHGSFASQHPGKQPFEMGELSGQPQVMWPDHCVQGTVDAEFHPDLHTERFDYVQKKGQNPAVDSYSAFRDNDQSSTTGLDGFLKGKGVTTLDVMGLATDFCVKFSVLDALDMLPGVAVHFIVDGSRGISPQGVTDAIAEMQSRGAHVITSAAILE